VSFEEKIEFYPSFEEEEITSREGGDDYGATVELSISYARDVDEDYDEYEEEEPVCNHFVLLKLWKALELCMTGEAV